LGSNSLAGLLTGIATGGPAADTHFGCAPLSNAVFDEESVTHSTVLNCAARTTTAHHDLIPSPPAAAVLPLPEA